MKTQKLAGTKAAEKFDYMFADGIVASISGRTGAGQLYTNNVTVVVPKGAQLSQPELIQQGQDLLEAFAGTRHLVLSVDKVDGNPVKGSADIKLHFFA